MLVSYTTTSLLLHYYFAATALLLHSYCTAPTPPNCTSIATTSNYSFLRKSASTPDNMSTSVFTDAPFGLFFPPAEPAEQSNGSQQPQTESSSEQQNVIESSKNQVEVPDVIYVKTKSKRSPSSVPRTYPSSPTGTVTRMMAARGQGEVLIVPRETVKSRGKAGNNGQGENQYPANGQTPREIADELKGARLQLRREAARVLKELFNLKIEPLDSLTLKQIPVPDSTYLWHIDEHEHVMSGKYNFPDLCKNWEVCDTSLHKSKPVSEYTLKECRVIQKLINQKIVVPYTVNMGAKPGSPTPKKRKRGDSDAEKPAKKTKHMDTASIELGNLNSFMGGVDKELKTLANLSYTISRYLQNAVCLKTRKNGKPSDPEKCGCPLCKSSRDIRGVARYLAGMRDDVVDATGSLLALREQLERTECEEVPVEESDAQESNPPAKLSGKGKAKAGKKGKK
ncbi:hypothetical protein TWF696_009641 [Orbilia brochopaga]|uniref:Uncharacterized protein n=1 Tax=Orbilia brochopaga TaxID=3140254 RepID=A0AAV9UBW5_9PEZI